MERQDEFVLADGKVVMVENKVILGACVYCGAPIREQLPLPVTPLFYAVDAAAIIPCKLTTFRTYVKEGDDEGWLSMPIYRRPKGGAGPVHRVYRSYEIQAVRNRLTYARNPKWTKNGEVRRFITLFDLFQEEPSLFFDDPIFKGSLLHAKESAAQQSGKSVARQTRNAAKVSSSVRPK